MVACPCDCSCHSVETGAKCNDAVTDEDRFREELGPGGQFICSWCYDICEGIE